MRMALCGDLQEDLILRHGGEITVLRVVSELMKHYCHTKVLKWTLCWLDLQTKRDL